jgi:hypothetical protein
MLVTVCYNGYNCMHVCMSVFLCVSAIVCMYVCVCVSLSVCMSVCYCLCVSVVPQSTIHRETGRQGDWLGLRGNRGTGKQGQGNRGTGKTVRLVVYYSMLYCSSSVSVYLCV